MNEDKIKSRIHGLIQDMYAKFREDGIQKEFKEYNSSYDGLLGALKKPKDRERLNKLRDVTAEMFLEHEEEIFIIGAKYGIEIIIGILLSDAQAQHPDETARELVRNL